MRSDRVAIADQSPGPRSNQYRPMCSPGLRDRDGPSCGRNNQPGVGDYAAVIKGRLQPVDLCDDDDTQSASRVRGLVALRHQHSPSSGGLSGGPRDTHTAHQSVHPGLGPLYVLSSTNMRIAVPVAAIAWKAAAACQNRTVKVS